MPGIIGKGKNTDKLLAVIEEAKKNDAYRLLTGFGIPNVGKAAAKTLLDDFGSIDAVAEGAEGAADAGKRYRGSQCGCDH